MLAENPYDALWAAELAPLLPRQAAAPKDYECFSRAVAIALEVPDAVLKAIQKYDLLWRPTETAYDARAAPNYYQFVTMDTTEREPVASVLSYLTDEEDPYTSEPYERTEEEEGQLAAWREELGARHPSAEDYLSSVARRLFLDGPHILDDYAESLNACIWRQ
jgi:hypothetical protein